MKPELDIVFSFDDTGSMASCRTLVKNNISKLISEIKKHIPTARVGGIFHNDYCDKDIIQYTPLTNKMEDVEKFLQMKSSQGGGDAPECYELAINYFHSKFEWKSDKKICILIGDQEPHKKGYSNRYGECEHDWKEEVDKCAAAGLKIYTVQCMNSSSASSFYQAVATKTNGVKLELLQFQYLLNYILAIFHKENDTLADYENSQTEFKTNFSLKSMFDKLFDRSPSKMSADKDAIWKFQTMPVTEDMSIKLFVESNGLSYKAGKGYYQLTKSETIQDYKEILMVKKDTDEVIMDTAKCRKMLGLPHATVSFSPRNSLLSKEYDIYVQSTSYNRKLIHETKFLYELEYK